MGCTQSQTISQVNNTYKKPIVTMIGCSIKGSMIMNFHQNTIQSQKCLQLLPRYGNALLQNNLIGFLSGGIQDLQSSMTEGISIQDQQYQGNISKKCYKIYIDKLVHDPESAFEPLPDMINARYAHCTVMLGSQIYVLGGRQYGDDEQGLLSACEKYNFSSKRWENIPNMRNQRSGAMSLIYQKHIYIFGGYTGHGNRSRVIESYSEGDNSWRQLPYNLHIGLEGCALIQNPNSSSSVFLFGGRTDYARCNNVWQINFASSTICKLKNMKQMRSFHKAIYHKGKAYVVGGGSQRKSQIDKQLSYLDHCSTKDLNSFCQLKFQVQLDYQKKKYQSPPFKNKVYIFGHSTQPFEKIIDADKLVIISQQMSLKHSFYQFQTAIKVNKEHCFIIGGINSTFTDVSSKVYSFNVNTQQIKYLQDMKTPRYGFSAVVKGSYLYVIGGRKLGTDDVAILNQCQRFSFETYKWQSIAPLKYKRHSSLSIVYGNYLMVIGGYKGNGVRSNEIEVYMELQNKWIQAQQKFELAVQAITPVNYGNSIYLFGGRAQQIDIQKVFKLHINIQQGNKLQKLIKMQLQPMGNLSKPGTNLKVFTTSKGIAYVFGNIENGIDVYDLNIHKIISMEKLPVFEELQDSLFQSYTIVF